MDEKRIIVVGIGSPRAELMKRLASLNCGGIVVVDTVEEAEDLATQKSVRRGVERLDPPEDLAKPLEVDFVFEKRRPTHPTSPIHSRRRGR